MEVVLDDCGQLWVVRMPRRDRASVGMGKGKGRAGIAINPEIPYISDIYEIGGGG